MEFKYLKKWVSENTQKGKIFKALRFFEDQFFLFFKNQKEFLQINFSSENSYIFFSSGQQLMQAEMKEINLMNRLLTDCRLETLELIGNDRIISLAFTKIDIYGQLNRISLIVELIPSYYNLILVRSENNSQIIQDCWKKISYAENTIRQILPGIEYIAPETDYLNTDETISYPVCIDTLKNRIRDFVPEAKSFIELNRAFEFLFYEVILRKRIETAINQKTRLLEAQIKKKEKKIEKLKTELLDAQKGNEWKQIAELLKANLFQISPGQKEITVTNYYSEFLEPVTIKLFEDKSALENMEYYFKKYKKAKTGVEMIEQQISLTETEIEDIRKEIFEIESIDNYLELKSIERIDKKAREQSKKSFKKLKINENWEIFIGRTNIENDQLTTKFAKPDDWWFHTRIFRGTHIILRNYFKKEVPEVLIQICSRLAAYYSKAKTSENVPVDYTQIRFVRKPKGSPTGFVTYKNQKTVYTDPLSIREAAELALSLGKL